jgi:hypothetical protein
MIHSQGEGVVREPDHLGQQLHRQELRGVARLEHELRQGLLGQVVVGLGIDDADVGAHPDLGGELLERDVPAVAGIVEPAVAVLLDHDGRHGGTLPAGLLHCKRLFCCAAKQALTSPGHGRSVPP